MDYNDRIRSNQLNPNNDLFWKSRGYSQRPDNWKELNGLDARKYSMRENPNNEFFWQHRGYPRRPDDWEEIMRRVRESQGH